MCDSLSPVVLLGSGLSVAAGTARALGPTGLLPVLFGDADTALAEHYLPVWLPLTLLVTISTVVAYVCGVAAAAQSAAT